MSSLRLAALLLIVSPGLPLSHAVATPSWIAAPSEPAVNAAQDGQLRYVGDGLTILVTSFDEATLKAAGTITLPGDSARPFTLQLTVEADGTQTGKGEVEGERLKRRLKTREKADGSIEVTYRAKRYTVSLQTEGGGVPPVIPPVTPTPGPGQAGQAGHNGGPRPSGTVRLRKHTFHDPGVNGIASHTVLVPDGWKAEGGPFWLNSNFFKVMPSRDITVKSPEGVSVRVEPTFMARDYVPVPGSGFRRPQEGQSDDGIPILYMPTDIEGWKRLLLEKSMPEAHPKATNVRVKTATVIEDLTQQLHKGQAQLRAMADQNNVMNHQMGMHEFVDGWVMGFELTFTVDGQEFEEARLIAVNCSGLDSQITGRTLTWDMPLALTFTAPAGRLEKELPLLLTVMNSVQETRPWMENRAQLFAKIMKISHQVAMDNLRAAGERSKIMASAYDEINEGSMAGYRSRNASTDRSQDRIVNSIHETDYYTVPGSSTHVQLPSGYDHVYSNGGDEYILTNDALFDPAVELQNGNWTAMQTARR
ncbi:hypothetical protein Poly30_06460 [Planctomycetes bacterium Poly30]|uniref:Uncharacterized protein n=1 Tax=Saltatorellus ferox TaxID=2528018 RepID=A0A518EM31_9BACT|nr:hypothetical protein Poly30_06460 [Planctomycetes bacterium Poly30]